MIRGTTPIFEFTLDFDMSMLDEAWVTFSQNDKIIIDKALNQCECDGQTLVVRLTQKETLELECGCNAQIQIRVKTKEGEAHASDIMEVYVEKILKDGEI